MVSVGDDYENNCNINNLDQDIKYCYDKLGDICELQLKPEIYIVTRKINKDKVYHELKYIFVEYIINSNKFVGKIKKNILEKIYKILNVKLSNFKTFDNFEIDNKFINHRLYNETYQLLNLYTNNNDIFIKFVQDARNNDIHGFCNIRFVYKNDFISINYNEEDCGNIMIILDKINESIREIYNLYKIINNELNNEIDNSIINNKKMIYGFHKKKNLIIPFKVTIMNHDMNNFVNLELELIDNCPECKILNIMKGDVNILILKQCNNIYQLLTYTTVRNIFESNIRKNILHNIKLDIFNNLDNYNENLCIHNIKNWNITKLLQNYNIDEINRYTYLLNNIPNNIKYIFPHNYEIAFNYLKNAGECAIYLRWIDYLIDIENIDEFNYLIDMIYTKNFFSEQLFHMILKYYFYHKNNENNFIKLKNDLMIVYKNIPNILNTIDTNHLFNYDVDEYILSFIVPGLYNQIVADNYIFSMKLYYSSQNKSLLKNFWQQVIIQYILIYSIDDKILQFDIDIIIKILIDNELYTFLKIYLLMKGIYQIDNYLCYGNDIKFLSFKKKLEELLKSGIDKNYFMEKYKTEIKKKSILNELIKI